MRHAPSQGRTPGQSQGAAATPPVSTPYSTTAAAAAFSPHGPRSSPQQFKKSPATSSTLLGRPGSAPVNFDSPTAAAALGALGLSDLGLGGLGGLNALGRVDDDERLRRLDAVIDTLNVCLPRTASAVAVSRLLQKASKGRVSEAGLERLAKGMGLDPLWEEGMGGDEPKSRTLIIAGSVLALDIVFSNNVVKSTELALSDASESVNRHAEKAGKILRDDLQLLPGQSPLTKKLDKFAANLQRLAVLDKLSVLPALNLHEAVAGIYDSLARLHAREVERTQQHPFFAEKDAKSVLSYVLRKKSGYPAMHIRERIGLSLDYWKDEGLHADSPSPDDGQIWGLLISCAPLPGMSVLPARVSDKWLGADVERTNLTDEGVILNTQPVMDWLNPDDTYITPAEPTADLEPGVVAKLPEVMFVATFDPPVVVPLNIWENLHNLLQLTPSTEFSYLTFDNIIFPVPPGTHHDPSEPRSITAANTITFPGPEGKKLTAAHKSTLFIYKPVYGRTLTEVPFSHPRQLVAILPLLRQYAFLSVLLQSTFGDKHKVPGDVRSSSVYGTTATTTTRDDFDAFMDDADGGLTSEPAPIQIDVTLTANPMPRLQMVFPYQAGVADVILEIRENAEVQVISENITGGELDFAEAKGKEKERERKPETLARLLEKSEDIGTWCTWIRARW
jgi:hypothetical protein